MKKRKQKRIIKRLPVKFGTSDPDMLGFTSDISPIGMFIRTNRGLPPETSINITLETPTGETIFLKGIVRRATKYSSQLGGVMKNGMGVEIESSDVLYLDFLKRYYEFDQPTQSEN